MFIIRTISNSAAVGEMSEVGHADRWSEVTLELKCGNAWGQPRGGQKEGRVPGPCGGVLVAAQGPGDGQCGSVGSRGEARPESRPKRRDAALFFKCEVSG